MDKITDAGRFNAGRLIRVTVCPKCRGALGPLPLELNIVMCNCPRTAAQTAEDMHAQIIYDLDRKILGERT